MSGRSLSTASARVVCELIADDVMRQSLANAAPDLTLAQGEQIVRLCRAGPRGRAAFQAALVELAHCKPKGEKP